MPPVELKMVGSEREIAPVTYWRELRPLDCGR